MNYLESEEQREIDKLVIKILQDIEKDEKRAEKQFIYNNKREQRKEKQFNNYQGRDYYELH